MAVSIEPGGQIDKDPSDWTVLVFDWDTHLPATVELMDEGVFVITTPYTTESPINLAIDVEALLSGNRSVQFRLKDGTPGVTYKISHFVETNENPQQKRDRSFFVIVAQR